jgi:sarcosine oxidase subunit gamma
MADLATPTDFSLSASDCPLVQIEGWDDALEKFEASLSQALGTPLPALVGETVRHADSLIVRIAPRRFWLISTGASQAPSPAVDAELGCQVPLGEGRVRFTMTGARVPKVLSACIAVDWHSPAAAPGRALHTSFHHIPVLFVRTSEAECELIVPRSFARSVQDWLADW